ncbi:putative abhydrolase domain-containing protein [Abeliophyllum distichum]|uniref:Abhydrolase domain-containing protein n=1 Tax=Abeliophyllum distichum TaxID=126358 RepID=A0ABD1Q6A3_9LAMI
MESDGGGHVLVVPALVWHGDAFARVPNSVPTEEVVEQERQGGGGRLVLLLSLGVTQTLSDGLSLFHKTMEGVVVLGSLPRCELSRESNDVLWSIYKADSKSRSYDFILNRQRCLVELGLVASAAEMEQGRRPRPTLAKLTKSRPKALVPGSAEDASQRKAVEDLSRAGNKEVAGASKVIEVDDAIERTLTINASGEVVLEGPSKTTPHFGRWEWRALRLQEALEGDDRGSGLRIPDDSLRNVCFYPSMGAQAVKKYFTAKWEEFSSHGELEDVLETSLASAIRASTLQMKVLGKFRTRMQEQKRLAAQASKADKEHQQALEGLKAALETAQKVAAEALEAANKEKKRLLEEAKSREEEISGLRKELANSEKGKKEAEDGKKEVEERLANAKADFVANFHNTEAYTNFAEYFSRVGQQEVLTVLRNDHPEFDVKNLEVRSPPPDAEGEEDS